jgi:CubicO group peptidase (beta-lactamase class C family)
LCHRTGLGANELLWRHASWSPEEAVRRAGKLPLQHPFRTRLQYQSTMAAAAGLGAAAAGKGTWEGLVRRKLLEPLGMTATYLTTAEAEKSGQLAASHAPDRTGAPAVMRTYRFAHPDPACGAYSTARDLGRWLRFHLNEGAVNGKAIISAERLRETHTPHVVNHLTAEQWALWPDTTQFGYALGWVVYDHNGHRVVSHGGAIDGFRSHVLLVPEKKIGIAIFVNLHQSFLPVPLANTLLDHLLGLPKRDWHALHRAAKKRLEEEEANDHKAQLARRKLGTTPTRELAAYAGTYRHPAYGTAKVSLRRGGLVWSWRDEEAALEHFHYNTFTAAAEVIGDAEVTFTLDETGAVSELAITGGLNVTFHKAPAGRKSP